MTRQGGGTKRSSWLTFKRCMLIVRLLQRAPRTKTALIEAVRAELGEEAYTSAAESAFKHDLDALKREYGCEIVFDRSSNCYALKDLGELSLLDLPDTSLEALAFLQSTFQRGSDMPEHANIPELLDRVLHALPPLRQEQHQRGGSDFRLRLTAIAPSKVDDTLLAMIKRAIRQRREIQFLYRGGETDGEPRMHRVAPYQVYYRAESHAYLDATVLEVTPPGHAQRYAAVDFRIDRIVPGTLQVLNTVLPKERIVPPTHTIRYRLVPAVAARRDVAAYFPDTQFTYHDDGSATVTATVTNLWQARQILLRYGTGCVVDEPPELVEKFREAANGLAEIYGSR